MLRQYELRLITQPAACQILRVSPATLFRYLKKLGEGGVEALKHGNTGKRPHNRMEESRRSRIVDLISTKYSAITSETLTGRVLGESRTATVGTKTLILANGNNVAPIGDRTRRTIPINIDAKEEIPASRIFKNPKLLQQVRENREHYVSAALTIISSWITAGKPNTPCPNLNSFEEWSEWCRQPLLWLGLTDPVKKVFTAMDEDPERIQVGRVFNGIRREFGIAPFYPEQWILRYLENLLRMLAASMVVQ